MSAQYHALSFSNFFYVIRKNTIHDKNGVMQCFESLMEWSGLKMNSSAALSPYVNGKRELTSYAEIIEMPGMLSKAASCIEKNIIPYLYDVEQTIADLSLLTQSDIGISTGTLKQFYSLYTNPSLFIASLLYYALTKRPNSEVSLSDKSWMCLPSLVSPANNIPKCRNVILGREKELKRIEQLLKKHSFVFLWGLPGIGKSELAKHYVRTLHSSFSQMIYVPYVSNMKNTIANITFIGQDSEASTEEKFKRNLQYLCNLPSSAIVLLDNFNTNAEMDPDFETLINCDFQLIITSRNKPVDYPSLRIKELHANKCIELFKLYGPDYSESRIKSIIEKVYHHTLLIIMIAKILKYTELEYSEVMVALEEGLIEMPTQTSIPITKDDYTTSAIYQNHILNLIKLTNIPIEDIKLLCTIAVLPIEGVSIKTLQEYTLHSTLDSFNQLIKLGFIFRDDDEHKLITMHPLVGEVVLKKNHALMPDVIKHLSENFLFSVYKEKSYPTLTEQKIAISIFYWIINSTSYNYCYETIDFASFFMKCGQFYCVNDATKYIHEHSDILNASELPYITALTAYYQGRSYAQLEQPENARMHFAKSYKTLENLSDFSINEAELFFNSLIEDAACIQNTEQSIKELEKIRLKQHDLPNAIYKSIISRLDFKLGCKYLDTERITEAKSKFDNCILIREEIYGKESLSVGLVHGNIGFLYQTQKDYLTAASHYEYALKLLQQHLPNNHVNIIRLHINLGTTYGCLAGTPENKSLSDLHFKYAQDAAEHSLYSREKRQFTKADLKLIERSSLIRSMNRPITDQRYAFDRFYMHNDGVIRDSNTAESTKGSDILKSMEKINFKKEIFLDFDNDD